MLQVGIVVERQANFSLDFDILGDSFVIGGELKQILGRVDKRRCAMQSVCSLVYLKPWR